MTRPMKAGPNRSARISTAAPTQPQLLVSDEDPTRCRIASTPNGALRRRMPAPRTNNPCKNQQRPMIIGQTDAGFPVAIPAGPPARTTADLGSAVATQMRTTHYKGQHRHPGGDGRKTGESEKIPNQPGKTYVSARTITLSDYGFAPAFVTLTAVTIDRVGENGRAATQEGVTIPNGRTRATDRPPQEDLPPQKDWNAEAGRKTDSGSQPDSDSSNSSGSAGWLVR